MVKDNNIRMVSITDHDSVNGLEEAIEIGNDLGIQVIPGVEISTDVENQEIHLLGYFLDIKSPDLQKYLSFFRDERFQRAKRMVRNLNNLGFEMTMDDVLEVASGSAIGRPHLALVMLEKGYVTDFYEAFHKYLRDGGPAYERKIYVSPKSALKLINDAGGLSFIAHPGNMKESILMTLIKAGVDGIEVTHPSHSNYQKKFYRGIVNQYCLLESGGSDFHGGKKNDEQNLGKFLLPHKHYLEMLQILNR
jgi:hypothetical protein